MSSPDLEKLRAAYEAANDGDVDPLAGLFTAPRGRCSAAQTILEECWRPAFARALVPKLTALERDLKRYLSDYNFDRAHTAHHQRTHPPRWSTVPAK